MNKFSTEETTQDIALRDAMQSALPVENASPALRQRVAQMAQIADSKREMKAKKRATRLRLAFSGAILASLVAVFALVWPQVMSNQALAQMDAAMARVSSVHMTRFRIEGAKKIKESESWYQNGAFRDERLSDGFASLTKSGKRWSYNARSGIVTVSAEPVPAKGRRRVSAIFTLSDIISDFKRQNDKISLTPQGQSTLNGREVKRVLLETKSNYETTQFTLLVDVETDLPLRAEINARTRYGKSGRWQMEMSYNRPIPTKLFEPKFARGAKFIDLGRRDENVKTRLARGLVKKRVGERTLAIRELEVNRQGDVFLFYTAGKRSGAKSGDGFDSGNWFAGRDWKVFLTDSLGTRYFYLRYGTAGFSAPDVQGQRLEADRWVPANTPEPGTKWKPRTFFVNFEMNPKNLHGNFKQTFVADYSARARFQIPVDEADKSVVPPLADQLLHLREETIVKEAAEERGELPPGVEPSPQLVRELPEIGTFSPDSMQIATGIVGGVRVVNASSGAQTKVLRVPAAFAKLKVGVPLVSADGRILCAAIAFDKTLEADSQWCVWSLGSGQLLGSWRWNAVPDISLRNVQLSPDGKTLHIVSSLNTKRGSDGKIDWVESEDIQVQERDVLTGKGRFERVLKHQGFVVSVDQTASNSADWLVVTNHLGNQKRGATGVTRAWNARSGVVSQTFGGTPGYENVRIVLAKRAPMLATWGNYFEDKNGSRHVMDKEIRLYDTTSGKLQRTITPNTDWVSAFALSDDGLRLTCNAQDHTISIWNTQTGRLEQSLTGHGTSVYRLEFSADGKWLQSVDAKEKTLLWKLD